MSTNKKLRLYEISMTAFKTFYVEAFDQEDALTHPAVEDEHSSFGYEVDWEPEGTEVFLVSADAEERIRERKSETIFPREDDES